MKYSQWAFNWFVVVFYTSAFICYVAGGAVKLPVAGVSALMAVVFACIIRGMPTIKKPPRCWFRSWLNEKLKTRRQKRCNHAFDLGDLKQTGIEPPTIHKDATLQEKIRFNQNLSKHPSHTERVIWPCCKCGKVFYAHCGLDISPANGFITKRR
jgi:hypothetical protein